MQQRYSILTILFFLLAISIHAQKNVSESSSSKPKKGSFFNDDVILHFKLTGKLKQLFNDRGDNGSLHPLLLQYLQKDSNLVSIHIMAKTRGHFRRDVANCKMPPLLLSFSKQEKNYVFDKQSKLKLVVPCQGDEYVIKEWLVYKVYNIISERSLMAKLVLVDFEDSSGSKKPETHYCILLEDEKKMADRNKVFILKKKMTAMRNTNSDEFKKMAVFQYMIGNTDWSVPYLQNIILLTKDSTKGVPYAVPYDFDHSGIVDAPYAGPAPELEIANDRVRLYRGFCENDKKSFSKTIDFFNQVKNDIYEVYDSCTLLKTGYKKFVNKYLDDFYNIINNDKKIENEFQAPCRTDVRIELKGLKD